MPEQRSGVIVNLASIFGVVGIPQRAAYASIKHGVLGPTKVLGAEWADRGVRVVAVNPGYVTHRSRRHGPQGGGRHGR
jgi:NAD(P)-dependent dehydrogenase (short-subunit alcohol dehydrogenase family)